MDHVTVSHEERAAGEHEVSSPCDLGVVITGDDDEVRPGPAALLAESFKFPGRILGPGLYVEFGDISIDHEG